MEDFLLAVLGAIGEFLLDALIEIALGEVLALISRASRRLFRRFRITLRRANPVVATVTVTLLGLGLGFLSVSAFPYPLVHPSKVHGVSLLISPVITGLVMAQIGRVNQRLGLQSVRIETFSYGFVFAFAMALVRLLLVK